jgi:hypothetical protein
MSIFETAADEKERRRRQHEREWHQFMDDIGVLHDKMNTFKQRQHTEHDSIEEQLHFIRVVHVSIE